MVAACVAALMAAFPASTAAAGPPKRIVSMNVCTDQLVMQIAQPERIVSLSWLAGDPKVSAMADEATAWPANHGLAEEILPLRPDLVVAGSFSTRPTVHLLRRLGVPVLDMPVETSIEDIIANVRRLAAVLDEAERGEALISDFRRRLQTVARPVGPPVRIAMYWENGMTSGPDTLAHALVEAAGLTNAATPSGVAQISLEKLLLLDIDLLVLGRRHEAAPARAGELLAHPALSRAFGHLPRVSVPDALWVCGTPLVAEAVERLASAGRAVRRLEARR